MRILELILAPTIGGAETVVNGLAHIWSSQGHMVDVLALDANVREIGPNASQSSNSAIRTCRNGSSQRPPMQQLARLNGLRRAISIGRYDVLQAHTAIPNIYARLATLGKAEAPPVVITLHAARNDYDDNALRLAERVLRRRTAGVIAVNQELADQYVQCVGSHRFVDGPIAVVPNGIICHFPVRTSSAPLPTRFLALSRLVPQKDIETMIRGFDRFLSETGLLATLKIAGQPLSREYWERLVRIKASLRQGDRIEFLGGSPAANKLLSDADVFLHTSKEEGHSVAVMEAGAAGVPIVASDLPSIRRSVRDGALFFPPSDVIALAEALQSLVVRWPTLSAEALRNARNAREKYSIEACAAGHMAILVAAVEARRVRSGRRMAHRADGRVGR